MRLGADTMQKTFEKNGQMASSEIMRIENNGAERIS